jgi:protocatechuate 3,4-dioxygenase beta subunit
LGVLTSGWSWEGSATKRSWGVARLTETTMTRNRFVVLLAGLALIAGAPGIEMRASAEQGRGGPPRQGGPPRDLATSNTDQLATGKGVISGVVVVAGTGQPARRARVSLSSPDVGRGKTAITDDSGRFAFTALPEGRYNLSANKPGHISGSYGQRIPGRSGTPIQLADGQQLRLQMQIWRGSVITGTVLDETGEAIPNTPVRVFRYVFQGGQRVLQSSGSAQTDDRGVYRVFGLQPGEYLVSATPRHTNAAPGGAAEEARAALAAALERAGARGESPLPMALAERERVLGAAAVVESPLADAGTGYAPVYYPGTTAPGSATSVIVGPGEEKIGIDFSYQVVPVARIDGVVTSSTQLPPNVQITLVNTAFNVPGLSPGGARADANGSFRINNVPPGQYTLVARATIANGRGGGPAGRGMALGMPGADAGGRGAGPAGQPPEATRMWGSADVVVDDRGATNVVINLQAGSQVSGRVTFDGNAAQPADLTRMRVTLQPVLAPGTSGDMVMPAAGRVDADGRFTIASVIPGRYRLTASNFGEGWFLGSSSIDGQDAIDFAAEIKGVVSNAAVTVVDRRTELVGSVTNEKSEPVSDYTLIVFPADARYRTAQTRRITSTRPATDGRYAFRGLPPGDYRIAPVLDPEPGSWLDPAFLEELEKTSLRFTIADGEKKEQNLRVPGA